MTLKLKWIFWGAATALIITSVLVFVGGLSDLIDFAQLDVIEGKPMAWAIGRLLIGLLCFALSILAGWLGVFAWIEDE